MALRLVWLAGLFLLMNTGIVRASALADELTPGQLAKISSGKPLILEEDVPGEPWPVVTIWEMVRCAPEVLAGLFWDSELDGDYLPGCLGVKILSRPKPSVQEARFRLQMPLFLPEEVYVSRIELIPQRQGTFRITWKVLDSRYAKSCTGEIRIEGREGMSLMCYRNFMVPKSKVALLLRGAAKDRVEESVAALVSRAESEVSRMPQVIERQQAELRAAEGR